MRFEDQVRVVWRQRYWLVGSALLAAILVFVVASLRDTSYTTSAVIGVTPGPVIAGNAVAVDTVSFTASRYQRLVGSDAVLTSGASVADTGTTLQDMRQRVTGSTTAGSGTVTVTVTGKGADETARVATAVANATIAQGKADQEAQRNDSLTALRTQGDTLRQQLDATATDAPERPQLESQYQSVVSDIATQQSAPFDAAQLLQTPEVPKGPTGPGPKSLALFAFLAVLILGGEAIVLLTRRQQRLAKADADETAAVMEPVPASGMAPPVERIALPLAVPAPVPVAVEEPSVTEGPDVPIVAADQVIATILRQIDEGRRLFAIAGSADLSGTNEVTLALAEKLASTGLNTLVVEGDMTTPVLASYFNIRVKVGLTDVLAGATTVAKAMRPLSVDGLALLPVTRQLDRPGALLLGDNMQRTLAASAAHVVLVSLPPSTPPDDRDEIARQLDAIVLMVRDGNLRDEQVSAALLELGPLNNRLVAVGLVDRVPTIDLTYRPRRSSPSTPKPPPTAAELAADGEIVLVPDEPEVAGETEPIETAAESGHDDTEAITMGSESEPDAAGEAEVPPTDDVDSDAPPTDDVDSDAPPTDDVDSDATPTDDVDSDATPTDDVDSDATPTDDVDSDATPYIDAGATDADTDTTGDVETDAMAFAPEPVTDAMAFAPEPVTDAMAFAPDSVTDEAAAYGEAVEVEATEAGADVSELDDYAAFAPDPEPVPEADVSELDDYAAFAPDPEPVPEAEASANGNHDHVEDSPYEQSYDRSLHQS